MRYFIVWLYLAWCNAADAGAQRIAKVWQVRRMLACLLLRHFHYRVLFRLARVIYRLPFIDPHLKARACVATANKRSLLAHDETLDYVGFTLRRKVLELGVMWGQNRQALAELAACRQQLDEVVAPLHESGTPVILAPLHMVSDVLVAMVGAGVTPGKTTVIVSSRADEYQQQTRALGGIDLDYCSIHDDNREIAGNLMSAVMEAAENRRNIMIYPDITPDFTVNASHDSTAKLPCRLFERTANLHSGILRVARMLGAQVVFYHLYHDGKLKLHIEPPVPARKLKTLLPEIIEKAIRQHPDDWMLWHAHSLYFINE